MTIDEAITYNLHIAEGQDKCAEISVSEHAKERMKVCAADHRQLAEWLRELKETKRLLKAAVDAIYELLDCGATCSGRYCDKYCVYSCETCPLNEAEGMTTCDEWRKWKYADEALALIGGEKQ